ncbi:hypothetical protein INS49_003629 [Diaporthe citri]|uniref:uncharacterized protein n=1 Tax=Diaporthe citri TaxID=83186 RepID=UPI001C80901F|nr:uncharacterized protein INS49_003629 [Diaporthe citri]KAG6355666.1 hypothetical protein INS49_003629 [Diaporthe citri]
MLAFALFSLAILAARSAAFIIPRQAPAPQKLIPIAVGSMSVNTSLIFTPNDVKANPGDVLQFQFFLTNHTVTQSAGPSDPCSPLQAKVPGAIHSGFIPGAMVNGSDTVGAFDVMVMVVNGKPGDLNAYKTAAQAAKANTPGTTVAGGTVGRIPMANAIIPPA